MLPDSRAATTRPGRVRPSDGRFARTGALTRFRACGNMGRAQKNPAHRRGDANCPRRGGQAFSTRFRFFLNEDAATVLERPPFRGLALADRRTVPLGLV